MRIQLKKWFMAVRIVGLALLIRKNRYLIGRISEAEKCYSSIRLVRLEDGTQKMLWKVNRLFKAWKTLTSPDAPPQKRVAVYPGSGYQSEETKRSA